jgi:hypothetical protein
MIDLKEEAKKYDLQSLIRLQEKRKLNISLFQSSIKNERIAMQQEENAQSSLEEKLRNHEFGLNKLTESEKEWILSDIPKLKTTRERRENTVSLLKAAILEEQEAMDKEEQMINFLEKLNDGKK